MASAATGNRNSLHRPLVDAAGRLGFAATPTFVLMTCISAVGSSGMSMCSGTSPLLPVNDMALMYLLMSFFHLSPWLKLVSCRFAAPHHLITSTEGD